MGTRHDLYVMLHLPEDVAQVIVHLQRQLKATHPSPSKPMDPDRLHATLVPLGSYEQRIPLDVLRVAQKTGSLLDEMPFRVSFDTLQSRGPQREFGTVELAGHGSGVQPLRRLRRQLVEALRQAGWPPAWIRHSYYPHITVDYRHEPVGVRRIQPLTWEVTEVQLIDSHYGEGRHEVLARWPLQDRQPSLFD
ncbi:MAG: 2'-5' RNA ligase family protein [Hydrogenophaga sp.]|uniref:2'-5' RNA ligase family protein n=1 Tax=Hydrogenophaga sp. TaxID=1904254 RepID=UPI0025B9487D|nr:2'-5' RNA ligase family protein [Hydrogenophaga sp.]MBT9553781.1 2'-5' RNA ligase family protein [Hydrogenophaga sp.]